MMAVHEIMSWLKTLDSIQNVAIDDGGLQLVALDDRGFEAGPYLEVGGTPDSDNDQG